MPSSTSIKWYDRFQCFICGKQITEYRWITNFLNEIITERHKIDKMVRSICKLWCGATVPNFSWVQINDSKTNLYRLSEECPANLIRASIFLFSFRYSNSTDTIIVGFRFLQIPLDWRELQISNEDARLQNPMKYNAVIKINCIWLR